MDLYSLLWCRCKGGAKSDSTDGMRYVSPGMAKLTEHIQATPNSQIIYGGANTISVINPNGTYVSNITYSALGADWETMAPTPYPINRATSSIYGTLCTSDARREIYFSDSMGMEWYTMTMDDVPVELSEYTNLYPYAYDDKFFVVFRTGTQDSRIGIGLINYTYGVGATVEFQQVPFMGDFSLATGGSIEPVVYIDDQIISVLFASYDVPHSKTPGVVIFSKDRSAAATSQFVQYTPPSNQMSLIGYARGPIVRSGDTLYIASYMGYLTHSATSSVGNWTFNMNTNVSAANRRLVDAGSHGLVVPYTTNNNTIYKLGSTLTALTIPTAGHVEKMENIFTFKGVTYIPWTHADNTTKLVKINNATEAVTESNLPAQLNAVSIYADDMRVYTITKYGIFYYSTNLTQWTASQLVVNGSPVISQLKLIPFSGERVANVPSPIVFIPEKTAGLSTVWGFSPAGRILQVFNGGQLDITGDVITTLQNYYSEFQQ